MKLGVAFHIFSGLEFLEPAILNVKPFASYIVGVYSTMSYSGTPAPNYMMPLLIDLVNKKLLDELILYTPKITKDLDGLSANHTAKREIGRIACLSKGCTHFMSRDCDEFYNVEQFQSQLERFRNNDVCLAPLVDYVGTPLHRASLSILHVPVVHRIEMRYGRYNYGVLVSPDRMVCPKGSIKIFKPEELTMYHFSVVRIDEVEMKRKYEGHSYYNKMSFEEFLNNINGISRDNLQVVEDQFNIITYWMGEFKKYLEKR